MKLEVSLLKRMEPLQIPYPKGFDLKSKSGHPDDEEFMLNNEPRFVTQSEYELAVSYCAKLPYKQSVVKTGAVLLDANDPLYSADHELLDRIEKDNKMVNTRYVRGGGQRFIRERVLIIRERGYFGNGQKAIAAA